MKKTLHQMIEYQAEIAPEKIAIMLDDESISYAELNAKANQLADLFIQSGVCRGDYIAIHSLKSVSMLTSMWASFKMGAIAVPIDSELPLARTQAILNKCPITAIVCNTMTQSNIVSSTEDVNALKVIVEVAGLHRPLNRKNVMNWDDLKGFNPSNVVRPDIDEASIAYVLHTSGSTGVPKGVALSHRAGRAFVEWAVEHFDITQSSRLATTAPLHFDLSVFDVMACALPGATCILIPKQHLIFPKSMIRYLEDMKVTHWYTVPYFLKLLHQYGDLQQNQLPLLQHLLFAGEVMSISPLQALMSNLPQTRFHNLFGPTETNVCCSYSLPKTLQDNKMPIGVAASSARLYIVDANNSIIEEDDIEGELAVAGPSLISFYVADETLTNTKLQTIRDKHENVIDHVYMTGDEVTRHQGLYWFLGRKDNQIKRRGIRIELNEINCIIAQIGGIQDCMTYSRLNDKLNQEIICCVVHQPNMTISAKDIEIQLRRFLPAYMLPDQIYFADSIPITSTQKVDVNAMDKIVTNHQSL